jgi:hypothetical protein
MATKNKNYMRNNEESIKTLVKINKMQPLHLQLHVTFSRLQLALGLFITIRSIILVIIVTMLQLLIISSYGLDGCRVYIIFNIMTMNFF